MAESDGVRAMTQDAAVPGTRAEELTKLLAAGDAEAIVAFIAKAPTALERRQLFAIAQQASARRKDAGRSLDALLRVASAAIEEGARQAAEEKDPAEAARRREFVLLASSVLAGDLCECWPSDTTPRTRRHLEAGLAASIEVVRLNEELAKPPAGRTAAWWFRGAFELSLAKPKEAAASFERALDFARRCAKDAPAAVVPGGDVDVALASGALGLATKTSLFDDACAALDATAKTPGAPSAGAAAFAAARLRWLAGRLADPNRPADLRS